MEGSSNDNTAATVDTPPPTVDSTPATVTSIPAIVESIPATVDSTPATVNSTPAIVESIPAATVYTPSTLVTVSTPTASVYTSPTASDGAPSPRETSSAAAGASSHGVDPVLLGELLGMGVVTNLAVRALLLSGNSSVDAAFTWLSELSAEEADALALRPVEADAAEWEDLEEESVEDPGHKMVLVVDTSLGMRPGKMAAQVGHAVLGLYRVLKRNATRYRNSLVKWEIYGEKMVVVRGSGATQLRDLRKQADLQRLPAYTVADAGLTQISPGSQTVLAVFGPVAEVDSITGGLKLL